MRFFAFLTTLFMCGPVLASSPWSANWGVVAGFGGSDFVLNPHAVQSDPNNLFSMLSGSVPVSTQAGSAGGLGLDADLGWRRVLDLRGEWWWAVRDAKVSEDLGSGTSRNTDFVREVAEGDLLLRLGWPISVGKRDYFRPLLEGGAFGNRTLNARRDIGVTGGTSTLTKSWDGVPNEDWGWVLGIGFERSFFQDRPALQQDGPDKAPKGSFEVTPGIEVRYYDGQKDLDPKGANELKSKSWMIILFLGF